MSKGRTTLAERLRQLHAMLGAKNAQEREIAFAKINELLEKHRKNWTDLGELMAGRSGSDPVWNIVEDDQTEPLAGDPTVLDMVLAVINAHADTSADNAAAFALWLLLTYHYDKFEYSPRLAALSPVKGCGKTTILKIVTYLAARAKLLNSPSAASIYHLIDREHPTLAIDEGDGLGLHINPAIRTIMLSGHNIGSNVPRVIEGEPKEFDIFGPLAIAAIGSLPPALMERSVIIRMEKSQRRDLRRLDRNSPKIEVVHAVFREIVKWARKPLPNNIDDILQNDSSRHADNWRPLICIADSFGKVWGKKARDAAASHKRNYSDEDLRVILLADIRTAFNRLGTDSALSKKLVTEVRAVNDLWDEYPTPHGLRKLTEAGMAALLRPFHPRIKSVTIWAPGRKRTDTTGSNKGYHRSQFATAWAKYCPEEGDEPAPGKVVAYLGKR